MRCISTSVFALLAILCLARLDSASGSSGECTSDVDCANNGRCESELDFHSDVGYRCVCAMGYMGDYCDEVCPLDCENGGQCEVDSDEHGGLDLLAEYVCVCPKGFSGPLCSSSGSDVVEEPSAGTSSNPSSQTSTGAKFGIAVLVIVISIIIIFEVVNWYSKRLKTKASADQPKLSSIHETTVPSSDEQVRTSDTSVVPAASIV